MLGILYLILSFLLGREITKAFYLKRMSMDPGNRVWILLPAYFGIGVLGMTWAVYLVSWLNESMSKSRHPLFLGNLLVMAAVGMLPTIAVVRRKLCQAEGNSEMKNPAAFKKTGMIRDKALFIKELFFFLLCLVFLTWIFFYVFFIREGTLYSGLTVFSDYAPHTSMIRSFSKGNNFPTQYPHYGGEDVKYHFMFQFLVGNLEYLGLRLDIAYNLVSILSLLGMLMVLYKLACRLMGGTAAGMMSCGLFFFRSGLTFFRYVWEHWRMGDLWQTLASNTSFIGYTENENWGLWCFNVYLNQRHLAFGLLIVGLVLWMFLDWLETGAVHEETGTAWLKPRLFSKEAWLSMDWRRALFAGLILGLTSFWNGAAVIGGLLILAGFAVFSDDKMDYVILAAVTILLSVLQVHLFMNSSPTSLSFHWGLLAADKSPAGVLWYLFQISGFFFPGLLVLCLCLSRLQKMALLGFSFPLFFAFTVSLTPDIAVNHKYVMISYAFLTMYWAWAMVRIWEKGHGLQFAAVLLGITLTLTGIYDFVIVVRNNGQGHRITVDLQDDTLQWLTRHLDSTDLILTPPYSINEVTLSGVMLYCGWPYYAWSAGYDTDARFQTAKEIYSSEDPGIVSAAVREEQITYILWDDFEQDYDGVKIQEEVIAQLYPLVFTSEDGCRRIYDTSKD